jgi:hypothetical protein
MLKPHQGFPSHGCDYPIVGTFNRGYRGVVVGQKRSAPSPTISVHTPQFREKVTRLYGCGTNDHRWCKAVELTKYKSLSWSFKAEINCSWKGVQRVVRRFRDYQETDCPCPCRQTSREARHCGLECRAVIESRDINTVTNSTIDVNSNKSQNLKS